MHKLSIYVYVALTNFKVAITSTMMLYFYFQGYASANLPPLGTIVILGVPTKPNMVKLNGVTANNYNYDSSTQMLELNNIGIKMDGQLNLMWG
jgi:hypothetical protein